MCVCVCVCVYVWGPGFIVCVCVCVSVCVSVYVWGLVFVVCVCGASVHRVCVCVCVCVWGPVFIMCLCVCVCMYGDRCSSELICPFLSIQSLILKMLMFTLAIPCLTTSKGDTWEITLIFIKYLMLVSKNLYLVHQTHDVNKLRCPSINGQMSNMQCIIIQPQERVKLCI